LLRRVWSSRKRRGWIFWSIRGIGLRGIIEQKIPDNCLILGTHNLGPGHLPKHLPKGAVFPGVSHGRRAYDDFPPGIELPV